VACQKWKRSAERKDNMFKKYLPHRPEPDSSGHHKQFMPVSGYWSTRLPDKIVRGPLRGKNTPQTKKKQVCFGIGSCYRHVTEIYTIR